LLDDEEEEEVGWRKSLLGRVQGKKSNNFSLIAH
jgi:hypothetical protein